MTISNTLSRRLDHHPDIDENDTEQTLLSQDLFIRLIDLTLQEKCTQKGWKEYQELHQDELLHQDWKVQRVGNTNNYLQWYKGKLYIPEESKR